MAGLGLSLPHVAVRQRFGFPPPVLRSLPPYEGPIASRCGISYARTSANKQLMSRSPHFARQDITALKVVFANWKWDVSTRKDSGSQGAQTIQASIEYPEGTCTPLLFGGATSGAVADAANLVSDPLAIAIPNGALFWVRAYIVSASASVFLPPVAGQGRMNLALGQRCDIGAAVTNTVLGGAMTAAADQNQPSYVPHAILGQTTKPSFTIYGDSRSFGFQDSEDGTGDQGEIARSIGPYCGYINLGSYGEEAAGINAADGGATTDHGGSLRLAARYYASNFICEYGINSVRSGGGNRSLATVQNDLITAWTKMAAPSLARRGYQVTLPPGACTSTDGFTTVANQTPDASDATRVALNTWLRDGAPLSNSAAVAVGTTGATRAGDAGHPLLAVLELADTIESSRNSGRWRPGTTTDGIHENPAGYLLERVSRFAYPALGA